MGDYQLIYTAIGAIVFVSAIIGGRFFLVSNFASADIVAQTTMRELNSMALSYDVLDCLKQGGDSVDKAFLEQSKGTNICDLCGICNIVAEAKVTDLETTPQAEWEFDYTAFTDVSKFLKEKVALWKGSNRYIKSYSIYINIGYGADSHSGRLEVSV